MNKALLIIVTVAVLGVLASYISPVNPPKGISSLKANSGTVASTSNNQTNQSSNTTASATPAPSNSSAPATTNQSSGLKDGTFTGNNVPNPYGDVQISIQVSGGKITNVNFISMPSDNRHSQSISSQVGPMLKSETLASQSANIDTISGATYTSQSYIDSLQSAINQAKV